MSRIWCTFFLMIFPALSCAWAKSAQDYYHAASSMYIEGRNQQALIEVEEGLRKFPADPNLQTLGDHLKKLQEDQRPQNQSGNGGEQNQNADSSQNQENQGDKADADKQPEPQSPEDSSGSDDSPGQPEDKQEPDSAQPSLGEPPPAVGEMTEEEAKQLLDAYKNDEKEEQKNLRKAKGARGGPSQDW